MATVKVAAAFMLGVLAIVIAGCATYETEQQTEELQPQPNVSEVVLKEGCNYSNPSCSEGYDCVNNTCILKSGCSYNNPPCNSSYECVNNGCMLKRGCNYNNPSCELNHSCIDNSCILKKGCKYNNPPCNSSQICQNNKCFEHILSSGGGGY